MNLTKTEKEIIRLIEADSTISAKAIGLELEWSQDDCGRNVRKYLKRLSEKGAIQIVPQHIKVVIPKMGEEV